MDAALIHGGGEGDPLTGAPRFHFMADVVSGRGDLDATCPLEQMYPSEPSKAFKASFYCPRSEMHHKLVEAFGGMPWMWGMDANVE